jgi:hypothetical protein
MYTYWQQRRIFFQRTGGFFGAAGSARGLGTLLGWSNAGCPQPNMVQKRVIRGDHRVARNVVLSQCRAETYSGWLRNTHGNRQRRRVVVANPLVNQPLGASGVKPKRHQGLCFCRSPSPPCWFSVNLIARDTTPNQM